MAPKEFCKMLSRSKPGPGDGGKTGSWRVLRPVIDLEKCIPAKKNKKACFTCWLYCPDSVVSKTVPPSINLEYCKGCGICAEECPAGAIEMVDESSFIVEDK
ncbi:4Fe-4S binding protein [Desulforhopalus singaporensis]|uniref:Pyruvate ferredoxin oxidoreductase delta subunit n=1 Tax=Desulforhopalus singaporensis TaxID=91360 RepID=A0A1H0LCH9_9BACT|nr:4Fe-4S binding protein [Desulforhopalus singaporensis]SDO65959.1 pyruvate ferredoxin oxidoreductase delta subunit [Desulforhopalus singaporensis]